MIRALPLKSYWVHEKKFDALRQEWVHTTLYLIAKEMQLEDIFYEEIFNRLSIEKQSVIIGRKADFAQKAEIRLSNKF